MFPLFVLRVVPMRTLRFRRAFRDQAHAPWRAWTAKGDVSSRVLRSVLTQKVQHHDRMHGSDV